MTAEKLFLQPRCPLPLSVCLFPFTHTVTDVMVHSYIQFPHFECSLPLSSKPQMFGLHSSIEEQQAALQFSLAFFGPKAIPLLESVTNSFSQL